MKRFTAFVLCLLMVLTPFITACSNQSAVDTKTEEEEQAEAVTTETAEAVTEETDEEDAADARANVKDDLPDNLDYNGAQFNILARSKTWFEGEMYAEELNGEALNDAVYNRDLTVEDRLNVKIDYALESDTNSIINKNVTAGSDEYQMHVGSAVDTVQYGIKGNYYNLLGSYPEYLNLDQPWWSQYYTQQGSIENMSFFATGDLCFSLIKLSFVTYVNLNMLTDLGLESPYTLVREGTWTFTKEMEMASTAVQDVNGNGQMDKDTDIYGMSIGGEIGIDPYWSAFNLTIVSKDADDKPSLDVDVEKMSSVVTMLADAYASDGVYTPTNNSDGEQDEIAQMIAEDRMLFSPLRIMHTEQLRDMESDYGLIPLPKYDESQENYYTFVHDQYSIIGIPVSVLDPSMASAVIEALAAESYRYVTPAYYDVVLNGKYLRDTDSSEMLEIAIDGVKIDFGWIHTYSMSSIAQNLLRGIIYAGNNNFASVYAKGEKMYGKVMDKLITNVEKLKDSGNV